MTRRATYIPHPAEPKPECGTGDAAIALLVITAAVCIASGFVLMTVLSWC